MRIAPLAAFFALLLPSLLLGAPDLSQTIAELQLTDGRVLKEVDLKAYNSKGVMVRHAGGVAQINYELFPDEYREAVVAKRPAPSAPSAAVAPRTPAPAAQRPPQAAPAKQERIRARSFEGVVFVQSGRKQVPLGEVEIRVLPIQLVKRFDETRRSAFTPAHLQVRSRLNGKSGAGMPNMAEIQEFYRTEYESWNDLPASPYSTKTDAGGRFALLIPAEGDWAVCARAQRTSGESSQYYVWALLIRDQALALNHSNQYPMLRED